MISDLLYFFLWVVIILLVLWGAYNSVRNINETEKRLNEQMRRMDELLEEKENEEEQ